MICRLALAFWVFQTTVALAVAEALSRVVQEDQERRRLEAEYTPGDGAFYAQEKEA